ncbi:CidA/LrgA family protein [Fusibacter tunisiensis]|jgi:holin-like protein|uniref:Holin-like protein n=1 Tax=Fusibacter tunisiensis TaxID=1008308 RepID=A0ABS2MS95_9FIRM|nr:CidA/LrgA family protein [Fusibacter tunisiensis]MBM7562250.1 holin-like protein [Fusibacter tunisiensis]
MKLIFQFGILMGIWITGEVISHVIRPLLSIPGPISGMLLLFLLLTLGILKEEQIKDIADFLLSNIAFFFVPASVGIMALSNLDAATLPLMIVIALVSTGITLVVTITVTNLLTRKRRENG